MITITPELTTLKQLLNVIKDFLTNHAPYARYGAPVYYYTPDHRHLKIAVPRIRERMFRYQVADESLHELLMNHSHKPYGVNNLKRVVHSESLLDVSVRLWKLKLLVS
jgi:hypothetical protein